jgi:PIN domain nuclease of toxin-antitoxin system
MIHSCRYKGSKHRNANVLLQQLAVCRAGPGLSFADRACLAMGKLAKAIVLTADGAWLALGIGVEVRAVC